jgi:hypothetical protein
MQRYFLIKNLPFIFILLFVVSCQKEEGPGGSSTIVGRVWVRNYNSDFSRLQETYWAQDEKVYILYGNDTIYSYDFDTDYAGCYKFDYLNEGNYTVYAMSKDSANPASSLKLPVKITVNISGKNKTVTAPLITILK